MIKKILLLLVMLGLLVYFIIAITVLNNRPRQQVCKDLELTIKDTTFAGFIKKETITTLLEQNGMYPVGKKLESISTKTLEKILKKHPLIDKAECYKTPSGKVCIEITQRFPILRVMASNGDDYYIDNKGIIMPPEAKCIAHRVIVTGKVEKSFAIKDLYKFGVFLQNNDFWNAQIEQVNVLADRSIQLIPRVGDHMIYLGQLEGFETKLERLRIFYIKGLNKVGWNKYSYISLEFNNQIICSKDKVNNKVMTIDSFPQQTDSVASNDKKNNN